MNLLQYSTSSEENEDDNIVVNNEFMNYTPVQEYESSVINYLLKI